MADQKENESLSATYVPEIFGNAGDISYTPYDFLIRVGLGDQQNGVRPICNLRLSPQLAKLMAETLRRNVELYEKQIGKIALPKEIEKEFGFK